MADHMAQQHDYYEILQVHPKASLAVIKKAYRTLMLELGNHPDRGGDSETAALISEAFHVLSDEERRAAYDRGYFAQTVDARQPPKPEQQEPAPPSNLVVVCPRCSTKNRVRSQELLSVAKCSRCGQGLSRMTHPMTDWLEPLWRKTRDTMTDLKRPPRARQGGKPMSPVVGVVLPLALMAASLAAAGYALSDLWANQGDPVVTASKLNKEGKLGQAAETLNRGIARDPKNPRLYGLLGDVNFKQGNMNEALENYRAAAQLTPDEAFYWAQQGNVFLQMKDLQHAEGAFRHAIKNDPHCAVALVGLGNIAAKHKDLKASEKLYSQALYDSPNNADILYNLGLVYEWDERPGDAIKAYTSALHVDPDHRSSMINLAALYYAAHQYDRAVPQYLKASHIKDADLDLHEKLADCFEHIGRRQEAIAEWKTCLEQAKDNPGASERARRALDRLRTPPSG